MGLILTLCKEIYDQIDVTQPAFDAFDSCGAVIGCNICHQASDSFAAEGIASCSDPLCIGVSRFDLPDRPKEAFGGALEESLQESGSSNSHIQQPTSWLKLAKAGHSECRLADGIQYSEVNSAYARENVGAFVTRAK